MPRMRGRLTAFLLTLLAAGPAACLPPAPPPPAALRWPALNLEQLRNAEYRTEFAAGKPVRLAGGVWHEQVTLDSAPGITVALADLAAFGDLDHDGETDAAVVLAVNTGGSGTFHYLAALLNREGKPLFADAILLGDRVRVKGVWIHDALVIVEMTAHGSQDPFCCPTQELTRTYRLKGTALVRAD